MKKPMPKWLAHLIKTVGGAVGLVLVAVIAYLAYVILSYNRIEDNLPLIPVAGGATLTEYKKDTEYTAVTQNIGFGAYSADFTFFMDGGTESVARSEKSVFELIGQAADKVASFDADIILLQEVDTDSTRSHHIDQHAYMTSRFVEYSSSFAVNYHSAFLAYPLTQPHGASNSGILTLSRAGITSALRRSLPISESFSKFLDLDRCYSLSRIPVEGGRELVVFNVHLSAYGGSDEIRAAQVGMLTADMAAEYERGNYVIVGGDFNHDFTGDSTAKLNGGGMTEFGWAQPFPAELIPEGFTRAINYTGDLAPTCRNCDVPYAEGNQVFIVDGFIVSDNITVTSVENVYTQFAYSDHCPVVLKFILE